MRLTELEPEWLTPNLFLFKCPHCKKVWISCKNVAMSPQEQFALFGRRFGEAWNMIAVPMAEASIWNLSGSDFNTMSVHPSINAEASGHWHGWIKNGEVA